MHCGGVATSAAGEFAKGAGKAAFEALKARLIRWARRESVALVGDAAGNPAYAEIIKADLSKPDIARDAGYASWRAARGRHRGAPRGRGRALRRRDPRDSAPARPALRGRRGGPRRHRHLGRRHDLPQGQGAAGKTLGAAAGPAEAASPLSRPGPRRGRHRHPAGAGHDVGLVIAIAERQGYLAPEKAAALAEQVRRTQADLEHIRPVDPDWRAEVDAAIDAFNRSDSPGPTPLSPASTR